MAKKKKKSSEELKPVNAPYEKCLNCGAELKGKYCYACGQEAIGKVPSIWKFIMVYINHTFVWDPRFFRTLKLLVLKPGQLTNDYFEGKHHSQEHPIKLNMFLLFVFITMFVFFSSSNELSNSVGNLTKNELYNPSFHMEMYRQDNVKYEQLKSSPRDTILLHAPLALSTEYAEVITNLETIHDTKGDSLDQWKAIVPHVLIEDSTLVSEEAGYYRFNSETTPTTEDLDVFISVWEELVRICTKYFPMIVLFTAPFVALSLRIVQRKDKRPNIHHFVFALHYTAILELLILFIYVLHLTIAPPVEVLQWVLLLGSCVYLTLSFRRVYCVSSWWKAVLKSIFMSLNYFFIILMIFLLLCFVAICVVVAQMV
jgi:hypothetical protein